MSNNSNNLGKIIKQRRVSTQLSLVKLGLATGVSTSLIARIERGERFPSARILRKLAKPLGFSERELLSLANYLPLQSSNIVDGEVDLWRLDPYVAIELSREPVEIQRAILAILFLLKGIAKDVASESSRNRTRWIGSKTKDVLPVR